MMNLDFAGQTAVFVSFFATLLAAAVPPIFSRLWSKRKVNTVFNVSDNPVSSKTCMRHKKQCSSTESVVLQVFTFFTGGLFFAFLVIRLIPQSYHQFEYVVDYFNSTLNVSYAGESKFSGGGMPYVELAISGFFFVVYFLEQLLQAFTGWDGWHGKSSFVHLPAVDVGNQSSDRRKSDEMPLDTITDSNLPSLVSISKNFEEDITNDRSIETSINGHQPNCPLSKAHSKENGVNCNRSSKKLKLPSRPSRPSSIIIVLPSLKSEDHTLWLQLRMGLGFVASVTVHQLTNGTMIAIQDANWCWISMLAVQSHSLMTAIMVTSKLMKNCGDPYLMFLCQLIFSSITPFGIIISSMFKVSPLFEMILIGLSNGATFHLVFMTLLQRERCTRLAGLVQYLSMYSGFTIMLCITLFASGN